MKKFKFSIGEMVKLPDGTTAKIILRTHGDSHNIYKVSPSVLGGTISNYPEDELVKKLKRLGD